MKKLAVIIGLCCVVLMFSVSAYAETRNAFEFNELFRCRLDLLDKEFSIKASFENHEGMYYSEEYMNSFAGENEYYVRVPAGTLLVSMPDFGVVRFEGKLLDLISSDEESEIDLYRASMAYAALEYGSVEDFAHSILKNVDPDLGDSFIADVVEEFADLVNAVFEDESRYVELFKENGSTIHLASLSYEYYLQYFIGTVNGTEVEFINLIAETK